LVLTRQLIGNVDEVTDVRLVGGSGSSRGTGTGRGDPSHIAVATNCEVGKGFGKGGNSGTAALSCVPAVLF
jgi:hypothetical protein